ncbi:DUF3945 domain-containing protein [Elizabethkingia anophelis]|uniref:DUF3945 domain-containing protein n=1 Tax=Elizabethkingia anophelis TaxID=1117645 RepID=UPI0021A7251F|nr:DUF3945 domain-containing protein [Elizabethkingia anophelis]MCT3783303.1 DUF3945 domain-containing protein [Elizabethkingia anophelis]MCT3790240.1 DUF3945 domain-containing protein [Elizabethkingia anophelis]MCT3793782.1 DUF3945 domain-containing protein [Elizabethkingia anophelis]MCT3797623.1 DUF3945 domain-containing protein [Elizabethkingia anophelis]
MENKKVSEEKELRQQASIKKTNDTLLVLHHDTDTIKLVQGIDHNGNLKDIPLSHNPSEVPILIDEENQDFVNFYCDFYSQLKHPEEFSFFKVSEYEAVQTGKDLQQYIDHARPEDFKDLSQYEININTVQNIRNLTSNAPHKKYSKERYLYNLKDIDWYTMEKLGLSQQLLENRGVLVPLLKGLKTSVLVPINIRMGDTHIRTDARIALWTNNSGMLEPVIFPVRKAPNFKESFFGHHFTKEDQRNLTTTGNMGRVADLIHPVTNEIIPSLISIDRLTHELFSYRSENIRIPQTIGGIQINKEQEEILKAGRVLFLENILSRRGNLFNASLQFNAEKGYVEFLFNKELKESKLNNLFQNNTTLKPPFDIPKTFRGKLLENWQYEKLKAGEIAYINCLTNKKGNQYQGYISYDRNTGKFEFSFKNPNKQDQQKEKIITVKSKGRKL